MFWCHQNTKGVLLRGLWGVRVCSGCSGCPGEKTKHQKARFHNRLSGAGKPYVKEKSAKWKLSPEIMETIVDYVTSTQEMQSVAHGTLQITLDSGRKTRISGVIRKNSQAPLVRQLKALLQELGIKVPSERSLRRFIS